MRLITGLFVTVAIASAPLALAAPAHAVASGTLVQNSSTTVQLNYTGVTAGNLLFCSTSIAAASCSFANYTYLMGGFGVSFPTSGTAIGVGASVYARATSSITTLPDGTYNMNLFDTVSASTSSLNTLDNAVIGTGVAPSGDSSTAAVPSPTFTLTITPPDGVTCRTSGESATAGSWVSLPAANDCTSPAATPNAQLLGWATTPDFPTAIAQRQITNGWGAYEIFDESGRITAVFIPAGGAILVSAPGSLFPIWRS